MTVAPSVALSGFSFRNFPGLALRAAIFCRCAPLVWLTLRFDDVQKLL